MASRKNQRVEDDSDGEQESNSHIHTELEHTQAKLWMKTRSLREAKADLFDLRQTVETLRRTIRSLRVNEPPSRIEDVSSTDDDGDEDDDDLPKKLEHAVEDRRHAEIACEKAETKAADLERRLRSKTSTISRYDATIQHLRDQVKALNRRITDDTNLPLLGRVSSLERRLSYLKKVLQRGKCT